MFTGNTTVLRSGNAVTAQTAGIKPFADSAGRNLADLCYLTSSEDRSHRGLSNHLDYSHTEGRRDPPDLHPLNVSTRQSVPSGFSGMSTAVQDGAETWNARFPENHVSRWRAFVVTFGFSAGVADLIPGQRTRGWRDRLLVAELPALW